MTLFESNIKKFLIFSEKKAFLIFQEKKTPKKIPYILGNRNPKKLLVFQEVIFGAQKMKKPTLNFFYISGNGTFYPFPKVALNTF